MKRMQNPPAMVAISGRDVGIMDDREFYALIQRYEVSCGATVRYLNGGGIAMDKEAVLALVSARKRIHIPDADRMDEIKRKIDLENALSAAQNTGAFGAWRKLEELAQRDFRPLGTD